MLRVAVLALDGVIPSDLSIPCDLFGRTRLADGSPGYEVLVCAERPEVDAGFFALRAPHGLEALADAATVVIAGVAHPEAVVADAVLDAIRAAATRGARIASICSAAFVLAQTGLLDGRRATTHWIATDRLAELYPEIAVDADVLYVDEGNLLTSAGASSANDLCLHMIRCDHGAAVAAATARAAVMALERHGGQAQFVARPAPIPAESTLAPLLDWIERHLDHELSLDDLAREAMMSSRSLSRHFREQTGTTPLQWVLRARVRRAQALLETTGRSVELIARDSGFGSVEAFRHRFRRTVGVSPQAYRDAFRSLAPA